MCAACREHRAPNTPTEFRCEARRTGRPVESLHAAEAAAAYGEPLSNPYEAKARERKAEMIANRIHWTEWELEAGTTLAQHTAAMTREERVEIAERAGERAPSEATWTRVVELVALRERRENDPAWLRAEIAKLEEARREWRYGSRRQGLRAGEVIHQLVTRYRKRLVELDPFDGIREEDTPAPRARRSA